MVHQKIVPKIFMHFEDKLGRNQPMKLKAMDQNHKFFAPTDTIEL